MKPLHLPRNKSRAGFTISELLIVLWFLVCLLCAVGWLINIVKVCSILMHSETVVWTGVLVCRCIGIIMFPMGGFLGLFFW